MWCSSSKTLKEVRRKEGSAGVFSNQEKQRFFRGVFGKATFKVVPAIFQLQLWVKENWTDGSCISSECITFRTVCRENFNITMGRGTRVETGGEKIRSKGGRGVPVSTSSHSLKWCTFLPYTLPTWSQGYLKERLRTENFTRQGGAYQTKKKKKQIQRERRRQGEQVWGDYIVKATKKRRMRMSSRNLKSLYFSFYPNGNSK